MPIKPRPTDPAAAAEWDAVRATVDRIVLAVTVRRILIAEGHGMPDEVDLQRAIDRRMEQERKDAA